MNTQAMLNDLTNKGKSVLFACRQPNDDIYALYVEFIATGEYPYLTRVQNYVEQRIPELNDTQKDNLGIQIYISAEKYKRTQKEKHKTRMITQGWSIFTSDTVPEAIKKGCKIVLNCTTESLSGVSNKTNTFKPFLDHAGNAYLMKPRARTRGLNANQFCEPYMTAFYKFI